MTTKKKLLTFIAILALPVAVATGYTLRASANASECACGATCACESCDGSGDCGDCGGGCAHDAR